MAVVCEKSDFLVRILQGLWVRSGYLVSPWSLSASQALGQPQGKRHQVGRQTAAVRGVSLSDPISRLSAKDLIAGCAKALAPLLPFFLKISANQLTTDKMTLLATSHSKLWPFNDTFYIWDMWNCNLPMLPFGSSGCFMFWRSTEWLSESVLDFLITAWNFIFNVCSSSVLKILEHPSNYVSGYTML